MILDKDNRPILIIPDIHGEIDLLEQVLDKFPGHNYVFLGDLVDRGPDTPSVVSVVSLLVETNRAVLCWGNHEDMMVRGVKYGDDELFKCWVLNGGDKAISQYKELEGTKPGIFERHVDFIAANALQWVTINTPRGKILCSHASRPMSNQFAEVSPHDSTYSLEEDGHLWIGQLKHSLQDLPPGYLCSVHGHVPQVKPKPYPKYIESPFGDFHLLDVGSFFTGKLAVLDTQDMSYHLFTKQDLLLEEQQ